jgi:short-subunit dehydrogenase
VLTGNRIVLRGASVLVTGATGGIGQAIARALDARGAQLLLTGRRDDLLDRLGSELDARTLTCDLSSREQVERLAGDAVAARIDVLVANAGIPASGVLTDLSADEIDRMLDVNLRAPIVLARALAPMMAGRGSGHMVFVSSLAGKTASPASSLYSATKFGVRGFALGAREDLRPHGVGVSVVVPGFIRGAGMFADTGVQLPPGVGTKSPEDVAAAVIRAIERNRAELVVAPVGLRVGASIGAMAPGPAGVASRLMGSGKIAASLAQRQRGQR